MRLFIHGIAITLILSLWDTSAFAAFGDADSLEIKLQQDRYLGEAPSPQQNSNYTELSANLKLATHTPGFNYSFNPVVQAVAEAHNEFYFGVPEMYVQPRKIAPWFNLTVGRQKRHWSYLDEEFTLGAR